MVSARGYLSPYCQIRNGSECRWYLPDVNCRSCLKEYEVDFSALLSWLPVFMKLGLKTLGLVTLAMQRASWNRKKIVISIVNLRNWKWKIIFRSIKLVNSLLLYKNCKLCYVKTESSYEILAYLINTHDNEENFASISPTFRLRDLCSVIQEFTCGSENSYRVEFDKRESVNNSIK